MGFLCFVIYLTTLQAICTKCPACTSERVCAALNEILFWMRSKRDTGQFFSPITYPIHGKKLAQREDCRILRRCSVSPSPQLCRCLPKRHRAPMHGRRQHSWWSEPSPPGCTARLVTGTPRRRPPLSSGPTSVWRQPSFSAALRGRQRAARSFWRSGCGSRICAMLLRDTVTLRLDLPPPRAVLAGSPPDRGIPLEGFILLAPFRNLTMRSCFPRDRPSTASW